LLEKYRDKFDENKQLKHFGRIKASVQHMTALVNDVLFVNQAEFEKLEFQPVPLNLVEFFHEIIDELRSAINHKHHLTFLKACF
jgi:signal transduction histidine kinase